MQSLAESIAQVGLLQPIVITPDRRLVAGAHRLAAYRELGRKRIPALVTNVKGLWLELAEIDENLQRNDLSKWELDKHLNRRVELLSEIGQWRGRGGDGSNQHGSKWPKFGHLQGITELAEGLGMSRSSFKQHKSLPDKMSRETAAVLD